MDEKVRKRLEIILGENLIDLHFVEPLIHHATNQIVVEVEDIEKAIDDFRYRSSLLVLDFSKNSSPRLDYSFSFYLNIFDDKIGTQQYLRRDRLSGSPVFQDTDPMAFPFVYIQAAIVKDDSSFTFSSPPVVPKVQIDHIQESVYQLRRSCFSSGHDLRIFTDRCIANPHEIANITSETIETINNNDNPAGNILVHRAVFNNAPPLLITLFSNILLIPQSIGGYSYLLFSRIALSEEVLKLLDMDCKILKFCNLDSSMSLIDFGKKMRSMAERDSIGCTLRVLLKEDTETTDAIDIDASAVECELATALKKARAIVVTLRISTDAQEKKNCFVFARQFGAIFTHLTQLPPNVEKILVVVETVSSHKLPLSARRLLTSTIRSSVDKYDSVMLLSASPERLTRRSEEIEDVLSLLGENGHWFSLFTFVNNRIEWINVGLHRDIVADFIFNNRILSIKHGCYSQQARALQKVIDAGKSFYLERICDISGYMICHLGLILGLSTQSWDLEGVVRVSPSFNDEFVGDSCASLVRQEAFIQMLMLRLEESAGMKFSRWKAASAYTGDSEYLKAMFDLLERATGTIFVFTSLDRFCRRLDTLRELLAIASRNNNHILILLSERGIVDAICDQVKRLLTSGPNADTYLHPIVRHENFNQCNVSLHSVYDYAVRGNEYYSTVSCERSMLLPYVLPTEDAALMRAVEAETRRNEGFITAWTRKNSYAEAPLLDQLIDTTTRGVNIEKWKSKLNELFNPIPVEVVTAPSNSNMMAYCACPVDHSNSPNCLCECRKCVVGKDKLCCYGCTKAECHCPAGCPCLCSFCHGPARPVLYDFTPAISFSDSVDLPPFDDVFDEECVMIDVAIPTVTAPVVAPRILGDSTTPLNGPVAVDPVPTNSTAITSTTDAIPVPTTATDADTTTAPSATTTAESTTVNSRSTNAEYQQQRRTLNKLQKCMYYPCPNRRQAKTSWCRSSCYEKDMLESNGTVRTCQVPGCDNIVMPGTGKVCSKHVRRTKKEEKKGKEKKKPGRKKQDKKKKKGDVDETTGESSKDEDDSDEDDLDEDDLDEDDLDEGGSKNDGSMKDDSDEDTSNNQLLVMV